MQSVSQKDTGDLAVPGLISYSNENGTVTPTGNLSWNKAIVCVEHSNWA